MHALDWSWSFTEGIEAVILDQLLFLIYIIYANCIL